MTTKGNILIQNTTLIGVEYQGGIYGVIKMSGKIREPWEIKADGLCRFFEIDTANYKVHFDGKFFYGKPDNYDSYHTRQTPPDVIKQFIDRKLGERSLSPRYIDRKLAERSLSPGYMMVPLSMMEQTSSFYSSVDEFVSKAGEQFVRALPLTRNTVLSDKDRKFSRLITNFPKALQEDILAKGNYFKGAYRDNVKGVEGGKKIDLGSLQLVETPLGIFPEWILEFLGTGKPPVVGNDLSSKLA